MRPFTLKDIGWKPQIVPLDYSNILVDPMSPQPDPFIRRYAGRTYYDPWQGIDFRLNPWMKNNKAVERAIWTYTTASRTVPAILPTFLDPEYIYALPTDAPAFSALPRKASPGGMESYVRITAHTAPSIGYWPTQAESQSPEYEAPTVETLDKPKRICETWGGVSGFNVAAAQNFKDMLAEAHRERLIAMTVEGLEDGVLNGAGTGELPTGILTAQGTINGVNAAGATVTLAQIREAIRTAWVEGGDLNSYGFAITDPTTYDYVKALVSESLGWINPENYDLPWGLKTYAIDGIPFIRSRKMPTITDGKKIMFVDSRFTYLAVLQDVTTELYGKTKDAQEFAIKAYLAPICRAVEFQAVVYGID